MNKNKMSNLRKCPVIGCGADLPEDAERVTVCPECGTKLALCNHCPHVWTTRVPNPKACPRCKSRQDIERKKKATGKN